MIRRILNRQLDAFQREFQYDVGYSREFADAGLSAFLGIWGVTRMAGYRRDIPAAPWYAAKIVAIVAADCGSCTQLVVRMAEKAGIGEEVLRAIVTGEVEKLDPQVRLGYDFAVATLNKSEALPELRREVVRRWGKRALVSLSGAIAAAAVFPTLKTALGYEKACAVAVDVGGREVRVARPALV